MRYKEVLKNQLKEGKCAVENYFSYVTVDYQTADSKLFKTSLFCRAIPVIKMRFGDSKIGRAGTPLD